MAVGQNLGSDSNLTNFAIGLFSNWSIECSARGRPKPEALLIFNVIPATQEVGEAIDSAATVNDSSSNLTELTSSTWIPFLVNDWTRGSVGDRLIEIAHTVNQSWDGHQWQAGLSTVTPRPAQMYSYGMASGSQSARGTYLITLVGLLILLGISVR